MYCYLFMQLFVTQFQKDSVISFMLLKYKELEGKKVTSLLHTNMLHFLAVTNYQGQQA